MRAIVRLLVFVAALAGLAWSAGGAGAQQAGPEAAWQDVVTAQIEAFRHNDAPGAFGYAASGFQTSFPTAEAFFVTIMSSGYSPIMDSRSHSFGEFRMLAEGSVLQAVQLVGSDLALHLAIYQLTLETEGWRVQGVQLARRQGVGI